MCFEDRYRTGDTPWDLGKPDFNLTDMATKRPIRSCKALEIGCGTGDNAVWLARQGFVVTGTDISEIAVQKAMEKTSKAGVKCTFLVIDFLNHEIPGAPFGFVFDRGCFHSFDSAEERKQFAKNVASHLAKGGLWLSIVGSADAQPRDHGPPTRTARDIVTAAEPYFEILSLNSSHFGSNRPNPPRAWVCLMCNRGQT
ncbi:MAG: methyltransferase domain-containing protein [Desulfobacterales bacterium]|nr:methyltransferase domain-containing protein [Desulfobacterales bacterium]